MDRLQPCWTRDNFYETPMLRRHDKKPIKVTCYVDKTLYGRLECIDHTHWCQSSIYIYMLCIYIYICIFENGIEWLSVVQ